MTYDRLGSYVTHYLWWYNAGGRHIIACGKRNVHGELLSTVVMAQVTCTRCQNTLRFKGSRRKRPRHRYLYVVLDAAQRTANAFVELGEVIATGPERAAGLVRRTYLDDMISRADFDDQMMVEVKEMP